MMARGPKIQIQRVAKSFGAPGRAMPALEEIDLDVAEREFVCLLGPSGCGKSTLLNIVAGFLVPTTGAVLVDGRPVSGPAPERGVVFQEYALFPWLTVTGNVEFGPLLRSRPAAERRRTVDRYLDLVGLSAHADKFPVQLSGGMKQRVAIARALANNPAVILMTSRSGRSTPRRARCCRTSCRASSGWSTRRSCSSPTRSVRPSTWPTASSS